VSLAVLLAACVLVGCSTEVGEPARPAGVPADALWVGGVDGGVFVKVARATSGETGRFSGAIYYEHSGDPWYRGDFTLEPPGSGRVEVGRADTYSGWDGTSLLLRDGRRLVAVAPPD
jgi:hypothetical protein